MDSVRQYKISHLRIKTSPFKNMATNNAHAFSLHCLWKFWTLGEVAHHGVMEVNCLTILINFLYKLEVEITTWHAHFISNTNWKRINFANYRISRKYSLMKYTCNLYIITVNNDKVIAPSFSRLVIHVHVYIIVCITYLVSLANIQTSMGTGSDQSCYSHRIWFVSRTAMHK